MKKPWLAFVLFALCILPTLVIALTPSVKASPLPESLEVEVHHAVQIKDTGLMIINDTVKLSAKPGESIEPLHNYTLGFPYTYQSNLDYAFAYETSNPSSRLELELDASMGRIGFYGANVVFPRAISISNDKPPYEFTAVFVISNNVLVIEGTDMYNASFPAYPSLTQVASEANLTIVFPVGLNYTDSSFEREGVNFTRTTAGSGQFFSYAKSNLSGFSDQAGWFVIAKSTGTLELLEVNEIKRDIEFSGLEQMTVTDSYRMVGKAGSLTGAKIKVPNGAIDISAFDEFGLISEKNLTIEKKGTYTDVTITFALPFEKGQEASFSVHYQLPWKDHASTQSWSDFHVSLTLFENFEWTIRKLTTTIILPEGATLLSSSSTMGLSSIQNNAFRSSLTFVFQNATLFHNLSRDFTYGRAVFWESFRPTLWMGALVIVVSAVVSVWSVSRPAEAVVPTAIIRIRSEELKSFVDSYDERRRYQREIESLEAQARKGKIPRRNYKVRKMSIESRLASLTRDLAGLREKIRTAGPRYADLMRQIEVAEIELQGVDADIDRTEVRYRRGEISAAAYHKLLEDSYRRRDRAKTTIDGVLLRLREEII